MIRKAELAFVLERARVVIAIEREMSDEERCRTHNKYWVQPYGESGPKYFQVEKIDPDHYKSQTPEHPNPQLPT